MDMEEFRDITGYEGKYQVSNLGRVKSLWFSKEKILKGSKDKDGYLIVGLHKEEEEKKYRVHRLVAEAFIPNPNNYPCVNHKDENKQNNCVGNLEWCTVEYNNIYGTVIKRRVANTDYKAIVAKIDWKIRNEKIDYELIAEKQSKPVLQYTKDGKFIREWVSTRECGRNGFNQGAVAACCRGITKSYKGFIWKYK